jgi:hypothetical protein
MEDDDAVEIRNRIDAEWARERRAIGYRSQQDDTDIVVLSVLVLASIGLVIGIVGTILYAYSRIR